MTLSLSSDDRGNIIIEKVWQDEIEDMIDLRITAVSSRVHAIQDSCYITGEYLQLLSERIKLFLETLPSSLSVSFNTGTKSLFDTSLSFIPKDDLGHILIEVNLKIQDISSDSHHCSFFVNSEIGLVEQFGRNLKALATSEVGYRVELLPS